MSTEDKLFIHKYQPLYFNDFGLENSVVNMLKTLILIENLNVLIIIEPMLRLFVKLVPILKIKKK